MKARLLTGIVAAAAALGSSAHGLGVKDAKLVQNPSGNAPLTALMTLSTDVPSTATIIIESAGRDTITHEFSGKAATQHALPILGMVSNTKFTVRAELKDAKGATAKTQNFDVQTPPLPDTFPPINLTVSRPRRMEPGLTMIPFMKWPVGQQPDDKFGLLVALNAQGEIVWYLNPDRQIFDFVPLINGNFGYLTDRAKGILIESDMLGNTLRRWHSTGVPKDVPAESIPIATDTFHHNFEQMPNGNFLLLSTEVRHFDAYPATEMTVPPTTAASDVIGDILLEAQLDGKILRQFKLFDLVNPMRIGFESLGTGFYQDTYKAVLKSPAKDWSHSNSAFYDPKTDSAIVSVRHLDFVYKLDMKTGKIVWILGNHTGWNEQEQKLLLKPVGDNFAWQYHQHAAKLTPQGTVLLFDNGNYRAMPGQEKQPADQVYSRAVEFNVDEKAMTVEKVWAYGEDPSDRFHSPFICDVDWLAKSGNVLITDGGRIEDKDGKPSANIFGGHHFARIVEVTHDAAPAKVWEVIVKDPRMGWAVFRAERVAGLYR